MSFLSQPQTGLLVHRLDNPSGNGGFQHVFCGSHQTKGAVCPNCKKPLLRFFSLDTADERLEIPAPAPRALELFFCWRCPLAQRTFAYRLFPSGEIKILACGKGKPASDFPYPDYPVAFPAQPVALVEILPAIQQAIIRLNLNGSCPANEPALQDGPVVPYHQIGGMPILVQYALAKNSACPGCDQAMPFFACVGDDAGDRFGFAGNPSVQVIYHFCRRCAIMVARQFCD